VRRLAARLVSWTTSCSGGGAGGGGGGDDDHGDDGDDDGDGDDKRSAANMRWLRSPKRSTAAICAICVTEDRAHRAAVALFALRA
jgi:hypothetical protein